MGNNDCFMSVTEDDDVLCESEKAGSTEYLCLRSMVQRVDDTFKDIPVEEQGSLAEVEINYV